MQTIDQLGRDHRNMRRLLDIVEEEIGAYGEGRTPDLNRLRLIGEYTLVDARAAHIEDPLFGKQIADAYLFLYERILALHD